MKVPYNRFGGVCAILLGIGSLLYAVFFLVLGKQAGDLGKTGSWIILAFNGLLATAAYVALYERTSQAGDGFSLWGLLLGFAQGLLKLLVVLLAASAPAPAPSLLQFRQRAQGLQPTQDHACAVCSGYRAILRT